MLVERWQGKLLTHAWRLTGDVEAARDAVQAGWVEIVRGLRRVGAVGRAKEFVSSLGEHEVIPLDSEAAVIAGEIDAAITAIGRPIGLGDVLVAALAHRHRLPIVTGNETHFGYVREAGFDLAIDNWRRPAT